MDARHRRLRPARLLDRAYRLPTRLVVKALADETAEQAVLGNFLGPMTARLYGEHLAAGTPENPVTVTPKQARERYGHAGRAG
ncbi:hypothetical protein ACFVMC_24530 [Nocardia sp. NPDC127579]|uniref:hypothetical protein n=1 Tax=Nocardia sp. NPDC127579 TaxID=3345402 RepID=UPI003639DD95